MSWPKSWPWHCRWPDFELNFELDFELHSKFLFTYAPRIGNRRWCPAWARWEYFANMEESKIGILNSWVAQIPAKYPPYLVCWLLRLGGSCGVIIIIIIIIINIIIIIHLGSGGEVEEDEQEEAEGGQRVAEHVHLHTSIMHNFTLYSIFDEQLECCTAMCKRGACYLIVCLKCKTKMGVFCSQHMHISQSIIKPDALCIMAVTITSNEHVWRMSMLTRFTSMSDWISARSVSVMVPLTENICWAWDEG